MTIAPTQPAQHIPAIITRPDDPGIYVADFLVDSTAEEWVTLDLETEHNDPEWETIASKLRLTLTIEQAGRLAEALLEYLPAE